MVHARQWASGQDGTFSPRVHSTARSREYMFKCYVETDVFCCNKHKKLHASPKELFFSTDYYPPCKQNLSLGGHLAEWKFGAAQVFSGKCLHATHRGHVTCHSFKQRCFTGGWHTALVFRCAKLGEHDVQ